MTAGLRLSTLVSRLSAFSGKIIAEDVAIQIYEDAYYEFFDTHRDKLEWLINTASDVYDTAPSNVQAGLDYKIQEI